MVCFKYCYICYNTNTNGSGLGSVKAESDKLLSTFHLTFIMIDIYLWYKVPKGSEKPHLRRGVSICHNFCSGSSRNFLSFVLISSSIGFGISYIFLFNRFTLTSFI